MNNYRQITFRYLKQNKKRTILTIIGIVLAVSLFSAIGTFILSFQNNMIDFEKKVNGNYEVAYTGINEKEINSIKNNFNILNYGITQNNDGIKCLDSEKDTLLDITFGDENFYKDIISFDIIEGGLPKNSNEILLERKAIRKLNKNIGDSVRFKLGEEEKTYKISGFYKPSREVYDENYAAYGIFNSKDLNSKNIYSIFTNLKDKKDIWNSGREIGKSLNLSKEQIDFNDRLLNAMMQSKNALVNDRFTQIALIVVVIIILSTVAVIYNAFNISVTERIRQFGILRSIGASPAKIRSMVFMEGIIMYLISVPIGILLGYVGLWAVIKILGYYQLNNLSVYDVNILNIHFYPEIILVCSILAFITVFLAIITPMITASRISPIDAIRDSAKFKKEKIKRRKAKLTKLLFGIEGQVAYKNIRRNNKRFLITVLSLSVSFIMFVTITCIITAQKEIVDNFDDAKPYEAELISRRYDKGISQDTLKEIKDRNFANDIYTVRKVQYPTFIEKTYLNNKFVNEFNKANGITIDDIKVNGNSYVQSHNGKINLLNENSLKALEKYVIDGKIDMNSLKEGGVIIFDTNRVEIGDKLVIDRFTNYKVGDTIKLPKPTKKYMEDLKECNEFWYGEDSAHKNVEEKAKEFFGNGDYISAKVVAIVNRNPFDYISGTENNIDFIFDNEFFQKEFFKLPLNKVGLNLKEDNENTNKFFDSVADDNDLIYINFQRNKQEQESIMTIMYTFVYGFIIIVSLIAIVNIINTITMGLLLRKKEFATLSAIGMSKKQLSKMVILEGVIYGIIVSILGSLVSYLIFAWGKSITSEAIETAYSSLSIVLIFIIGIIGIITLTLIASLIPLRKFKKMNIIESIKEEE